MSYLDFDKNKLINLNYSQKRELIRSNRAGSYASTTITYCNTRKYHGLLVCPFEQLDGQKHVLLSSLDETIIQRGKEFHIGSRKYPTEYHPLGHKYIEDFHSEPIPTHIYRVGGVILKKEIILSNAKEQILLRYTLVDAHSPTKIRFQPYLAFRQIHRLSKANMDADTKYEPVQNGVRVKLYNGYPFLYMQTSKEFEYTHAPDWYYNVQYQEEAARGYESLEDLMSIGFFEATISKGESIIFSAGTQEFEAENLNEKFESELKNRTPRSSFFNNLCNAADQFFVKKDDKAYITAGFPWYGVKARDTFMAMPGLCLTRNKEKLAFDILTTMGRQLKNGLFPSDDLGINVSYSAADTPLWYIWAIQKYVEHIGSFAEIWKIFGEKMTQIIDAFVNGTDYNIKMHKNGLVYAGKTGKALTWMNAVANGNPVTPRIGFDVEINALWYNAIVFVLEVAQKARKKEFVEKYKKLPELIQQSFGEMFWDEEKGYLADYVNYDEQNWDVRPNQLLAVSLPNGMLTMEQAQNVLKVVEKQLVTPRGLRTLSPRNINYKGRYEGDATARDLAFHQGTVCPWLLGHFAEAFFRIYEKSGLNFIKKIYTGFENELTVAGIGTISEIYDGNPPHDARGATSQAVSVAEILRIKRMIEKYENS